MLRNKLAYSPLAYPPNLLSARFTQIHNLQHRLHAIGRRLQCRGEQEFGLIPRHRAVVFRVHQDQLQIFALLRKRRKSLIGTPAVMHLTAKPGLERGNQLDRCQYRYYTTNRVSGKRVAGIREGSAQYQTSEFDGRI